MLSRLLSWLGFGDHRSPKQAVVRPARPRSATAHLFDRRTLDATRKPGGNVDAAGDFNPYNTGKFDRSASWERISKNQR
jgi:hypothetical protein